MSMLLDFSQLSLVSPPATPTRASARTPTHASACTPTRASIRTPARLRPHKIISKEPVEVPDSPTPSPPNSPSRAGQRDAQSLSYTNATHDESDAHSTASWVASQVRSSPPPPSYSTSIQSRDTTCDDSEAAQLEQLRAFLSDSSGSVRPAPRVGRAPTASPTPRAHFSREGMPVCLEIASG